MRLVPLVFVLAQSVVATAQPCEVTIARAPDAVRIEIETWVRAEPRCSTSLEIRVIPTEGGYYLFARDPFGHVRERLVPDAQSAGVLVASWVADDSPPTFDAPSPSIEILPPVILGPGDVPAISGAMPARRRSTRWLTLGAMTQMGGTGNYGARGELDLFTRGAWTLGTVLSGSEGNLPLFSLYGSGYLETRDLRAHATVARTSTFGSWQLRIGGGLGAVHATLRGTFTETSTDETFETNGWFWSGEVSALLSRRFGSWAVAAGPVITYYKNTVEIFRDEMYVPLTHVGAEIMAFGAIRHEL